MPGGEMKRFRKSLVADPTLRFKPFFLLLEESRFRFFPKYAAMRRKLRERAACATAQPERSRNERSNSK
jgi:hypothetical protein